MSDVGNLGEDGGASAAAAAPRHPAVRVLAGVLLLECAALLAVAVVLVIEILTADAASLASAIGIAVLVVLGAIWIAVVAVNLLRGQAWTRAAIVVIQVLVAAVAVGSFQGPAARPDLGVLLLAPAVIALVLLFSPPVLAATGVRDDRTPAP